MREPCQQLRRRHAFMLLFVLVFIGLATTLVLLTAASTAQFALSAGSERTSLLLRQMIDSGIAWARTNRGTRSGTTSEPRPGTIILDAAHLVPSPGTGEIRLTYLNVAPPTVIVEAVFERDNKRHRSVVQFALKPAGR